MAGYETPLGYTPFPISQHSHTQPQSAEAEGASGRNRSVAAPLAQSAPQGLRHVTLHPPSPRPSGSLCRSHTGLPALPQTCRTPSRLQARALAIPSVWNSFPPNTFMVTSDPYPNISFSVRPSLDNQSPLTAPIRIRSAYTLLT